MKPLNRHNRPSEPGFTLMEMILAIGVSALILSVITGTYFSALQLTNRTTRALEEGMPVNRTLALMQKDLAGLMPPGGAFGGELQTTLVTEQINTINLGRSGHQVSPFFHTTTGATTGSTPFGDVQRVAYYLMDPADPAVEGSSLYRVVSRNLLPTTVEEAHAQWLMNGVEDIRFQYYDGIMWMDSWDTTLATNLPSAIKVQMALVSKNNATGIVPAPIEMVVPVIVQRLEPPEEEEGDQ